MKKLFFLLISAITLFTVSCKKEDIAGLDLVLLGETLKPYNYDENGQAKGITREVVQEILNRLELTKTIESAEDWDYLLNRAKNEDNIVLFTTGLTEERKDLFKWVGPIALWNTDFIGLESSNLIINSMDEAEGMLSIGVVKSYSTTEILKNLGFINLVEYDTMEAMIEALYKGNVKVVFENGIMFQTTARAMGKEPSQLKILFTYASTQGYLAFSKNISDKIVATWQNTLDEIKDEGLFQEIYDRYLPGTTAPARLTVFTENNPPQSFIDYTGILSGSSVDMVKAMMEEMGIEYPIIHTDWPNAYAQIQLSPNTMAFSTLRSTARESMFKWVGPVCKKKYCFFVKADTDYHITTLDDAHHLRSVATVTGWSSEEELLSYGFSNLVTFATPQIVLQKLLDGDVPCVVLNDISIRMLLTDLGHAPKDVRKEMTLSEGQTYLAFSLTTDDDYVKQWRDAYNKIVASGELKAIWEEWYPDIDW
jgi:polar amino acid transport system substrate-binding protein